MAKEHAPSFNLNQASADHDAGFRAKVREALEDMRPALPNDEVKAKFAKRREATLRKADER